jgi:predicted KAP-like P-loop ATPase
MEKGIRFLEDKAARRADSFEKKENSLQQMRKDLREAFRSLNTPIVIVIDDIDRLTEEEINLIFRLVKANADFPNLIFLLLFDRKTVETALDKISGEQGAAFLEKIVQVGIDLPPLSSDALSNVLFRGISEALEPLISENDFDRGRFSNLWIPGLSLYFQNLRDVNRFLSSFSFAVGAFSRNGVLEVNPVDLIAIETLRTTEPEVYGTIRDNKSALTKLPQIQLRDKGPTAIAEALLANGKRNPDALRSILQDLFPSLRAVWDNHHYSTDHLTGWRSEKRVCTEHFFDRYFQFGIPPGQVSEAVIKRLLRASAKTDIRAILDQLGTNELIYTALERLQTEPLTTNERSPIPLVSAVFDIADFLPRRKGSFHNITGGYFSLILSCSRPERN